MKPKSDIPPDDQTAPPADDAEVEVEAAEDEQDEEVEVESADDGDEEVEAADDGDDDPGVDWSKFEDAAGEMPAEGDKALLDLVNEEQYGKLPDHAKTIIKHLAAEVKRAQASAKKMVAEERKALEKARAEHDEDVREFRKQVAGWAEAFESPELKKKIEDGKKIDLSKIDPLTREGQIAIAEKVQAEKWDEFRKPFQAGAQDAAKKSAYAEIVAANPDVMKDPTWKAKVTEIVKARAGEGHPIKLVDAIAIVRSQKLSAERDARTKAERRESARSMRRVSTGGIGGHSSTQETPAETRTRILRDGFEGQRGATALAAYYKKNPAAFKAAKQHAAR